MKIESYYCDITKCKKQLEKNTCYDMQIIFVTEQTEGYPSKPYFDRDTLALCPECLERASKGNYIFGAGAQGHNDYYFKDQPK